MVDLISYTSPYHFYEPEVLTPGQLEGFNNLHLPMTDFEDFLRENLPRRLAELMNPSNTHNAFVFATSFRASEQESQATSEAVKQTGFKHPRIIANGFDRREFIGNHPMSTRVLVKKKAIFQAEETRERKKAFRSTVNQDPQLPA
jgi:hypothetical protein